MSSCLTGALLWSTAAPAFNTLVVVDAFSPGGLSAASTGSVTTSSASENTRRRANICDSSSIANSRQHFSGLAGTGRRVGFDDIASQCLEHGTLLFDLALCADTGAPEDGERRAPPLERVL